jgi:hypothetical protein
MAEEFLDERTRAEDILLGSLGIDGEATILEIKTTDGGYKGRARWGDGEVFDFESDEELTDLEKWAMAILLKKGGK